MPRVQGSSPAGKASAVAPPEGFVLYEAISPFTATLGAIYTRFDPPETYRMGLFLAESHCNMAGSVHGGVVATLCDITLARATKGPHMQAQIFPTANLNVSYLNTARRGEWLEVRAVCTKLGSRMAFATAEVLAGDKVIATATGVFSRSPGRLAVSAGNDA